jgi:hypothetical protein
MLDITGKEIKSGDYVYLSQDTQFFAYVLYADEVAFVGVRIIKSGNKYYRGSCFYNTMATPLIVIQPILPKEVIDIVENEVLPKLRS